MPELLDIHRERFLAFVARQRALADGQQDNIDLKREHTLMVLDNARAITAGIAAEGGLDPELAQTVHLAALYHDTGRFPQLVRYGTFKDRDSDDHGRMGVRALRREGLLEGLPPSRRRIVLAAVILHNRRCLPRDLPPAMELCARVVRDADKLDILRVMAVHLDPDARMNKTVTLGLDDEPGAYTPIVLEQVRSRTQANYADMRVVNDFKLLLVSWVYDLNFSASRRLMRERGLLDDVLRHLPDQPAFVELAAQLRSDLDALSR